MKTQPDYALPLRQASGVLYELTLIAQRDPQTFLLAADHVIGRIIEPLAKMLMLAEIQKTLDRREAGEAA